MRVAFYTVRPSRGCYEVFSWQPVKGALVSSPVTLTRTRVEALRFILLHSGEWL